MANLAVIPSDPIEEYVQTGNEVILDSYYNPKKYFDHVFILSPLENVSKKCFEMKIIPTKDKQLKRRLKELNIDVVRAYGGYWPCDMACKNKLKNVPVIVSIHDRNPLRLHKTIQFADYVICVSKAVKKLVISKGVSERRIRLLPNRVDMDVFNRVDHEMVQELNRKYSGKYKILHIGRKHEDKNIDTLIKSMKYLGNDFICLFVGRGDNKIYSDLAIKEKVSKQCHYIETIKNYKLPAYYSWSDCVCLPSRREAFSRVSIEALACKSVFVTSDTESMNEYIVNGYNGILVKNYEDPKALAECIFKACTEKELRKRIIGNARYSVRLFEKSKIDNLETSIYEEVLSDRNSGRFMQKKMPLNEILHDYINRIYNRLFRR